MAHLTRADSVCPNPQSDLLKYVLENNLIELENLLLRHKNLLSQKYGHPYNKPILYIACKDEAERVSTNVIDIIVKSNESILYFSDEAWDGKQALHFATLGGNPNILRCIIGHIGFSNINATTNNGNTALQLLIKEGNPSASGYEECASILLDNGIDINLTDNKNAPPIYWAIRKQRHGIIKLLLSKTVDLDSYVLRQKTPRDLLKDLNIKVDHIPENSNKLSDAEMLISYIKENNQYAFIELASKMPNVNDENHDKTFLQIACEKNLLDIVKFLLINDADPNRVSRKKSQTPLLIAASSGYYEILAELINQPSIHVTNEVLLVILRKLDYESTGHTDYTKCYEILMSKKINSINVNCQDKDGNYPLHYGARYGGPEIALSLLRQKASLSNRNKFGFLTVADVDYDTLKEHFDSCIDAQPCNKLDKENMTITFDYQTLLPSKNQNLINRISDDEANKLYLVNDSSDAKAESDVILYMSKSSELKTLLKHPLITSFLFMKWHRIRWIFYGNLMFYLTFCLSLFLYTLTFYNDKEKPQGYIFYYIFLLLTSSILFLRELFQIMVGPKKYLSNFENYIEISLLILVGFMLFGQSPKIETKTQVCAFVFLLAAFELLFLLGSYPELSTNIVMLRTVSSNFFKFLLFYSILIIAFAFCFHTLFRDNTHNVSSNSTDVDSGSDEKFFVNPLMAMFKTIIMLTGEFEAGDLQFDYYPVTSHLIFLAFVMTIAIILLNLLNGLAVSDTQEIKSEAELVGHIARAEYVAYAESMLFSNALSTKVTDCYYKLFSCRVRNGLKKLISNPITEKICLHPHYLTDYKLTVYPNQNGRVLIENDVSKSCKCRNVHLDGKTIRKSRLLIQRKKEDEKQLREKIKTNEILSELLAKVNDLMTKI